MNLIKKREYDIFYGVLAIIFFLLTLVLFFNDDSSITGAVVYGQELSILATNCSGNYSNGQAYPHWNISYALSCEHESFAVAGNITILNGGNLTLINTTLNMSLTGTGQVGIDVLQGGAFYALQNSQITSNDSSFYYTISTSSSNFSIDDSTVRRIGIVDVDNCFFAYRCGIYINASVNCGGQEIISDSSISNGSSGVVMAGDNCVIARNNFSNIQDGAVSLDSSSYNNTIISNNMSGFFLEENSAIVLGGDYNLIDNNTLDLNNQSTAVLLFNAGDENNTIRNNIFRYGHRGVRTNTDNGVISYWNVINNTFLNFTVTAIEIHQNIVSVVIKGNTIRNTSYAAASFFGAAVLPGQVLVKGLNSNITIQDNILTAAGNPDFGIYVNGSTNITLKNNSYSNTNLTIIASTNVLLQDEISSVNSYIFYNSNLTIKDSNEAEIFFLQQVNANGTNLSTDIVISNNSIFVNSSKIGFNISANLTFYNTDLLGLTNKFPYLNGAVCNAAICTMLARNDTFVFNVTHFTNYSLGEGSVPNMAVNSPTNGFNFTTQSQLFNATVTDSITSISTVIFMFNTNTTPFNQTASNHSGNWNVTVNMSSLVEGKHNATVYANNSFGFVNQSVNISFTIDITPPTITFNSPANGAKISGTQVFNATIVDALTDVGTIIFQFSNGTNPFNRTPTNQSGSLNVTLDTTILAEGALTFTVFANDTLGNINNTQTLTLTVDNIADTTASTVASSSSSGGGGSLSGVSEGLSGSFQKKTWAILAPGTAIMDLAKNNLAITRIEFLVLNKMNGVWISVAQTESPEIVRKRFYNAYFNSFEITTSPLLKQEHLSEITIYFEVEKKWLMENKLTSNDISLFRYSGSEWLPLTTEIVSEELNLVLFKSQIPQFSYFIIGEKDKLALEKSTAKEEMLRMNETIKQELVTSRFSIFARLVKFTINWYENAKEHLFWIKISAVSLFITAIIIFTALRIEHRLKLQLKKKIK
ncbi:PGF-pre-PGF domain-containing protein [Candidatus Woesearchaeota archaeon]|nr:PGF-pre-PGF domain-containing protein [Candidatus Woesearchaeota archaeon]